MTEEEHLEWYPKLADQCQLKLTGTVDWAESRKSCQQHRRRNVYPSSLQCGPDSYGVGLGYKHTCVPPMHRRTYFGSVLIGFENANATYLGNFLQTLALENKAFIILGDSLSYQTLFSIQCELYREQIVFQKRGDQHIPFESKGMYTFDFPLINASVDVFYKRLDNIRLAHQFDSLIQEFDIIKQQRAGYVLLANIGLNYNTMDEYRADIPK